MDRLLVVIALLAPHRELPGRDQHHGRPVLAGDRDREGGRAGAFTAGVPLAGGWVFFACFAGTESGLTGLALGWPEPARWPRLARGSGPTLTTPARAPRREPHASNPHARVPPDSPRSERLRATPGRPGRVPKRTGEIPGRGAPGLVEPAPLDEARSPSREQGTGGLPPVPLVPYSGGAGS